MELATLIEHYLPALKAHYADRLLPGHLRAISAIRRCRTAASGQFQLRCPACATQQRHPRSCGHRSCPKCQNHAATQWLERQRAKLLPVEYFMATFTLPRELRALAWHHQTVMYNILFAAASSTLKDFGLTPRHLGAELGMSAVLHTHSRRLDYHPHVHVIVPGGGVDRARRQWKKTKGKYLFNARALATVFRARVLATVNEAGLPLPRTVPAKWVIHCTRVGSGEPALKYLSRYLYRGVVSEKNIIAHHNGMVTFRYIDASTGTTQYRSLRGEDFLWRVLQHVLPKGFRRIRDYGFLHGNATKTLALVQWVLRVVIAAGITRPRPAFTCPKCKTPMHIQGFIRPAWPPG